MQKTRLRILQIVESSGAGVGRHVIDLTKGLMERGHQIDLIYSPCHSDAIFKRRLEELTGCRVFAEPIKHSPHPADIPLFFRLRRHLQKEGPFDIVHCHSTKAGFIGRIAAAGLHTRVLYTPHALLTLRPNLPSLVRRMIALGERALSHLSDEIIAVSEDEAQEARGLGISSAKITVIHNGVGECEWNHAASLRTHLRDSAGATSENIVVGFVGRFASQKAIDNLLHAIKLLDKSVRHNVRVVLVGDGPLRKDLQDLSTRLEIADHLHWSGETPGQQSMAAFDIFVLPSDYEGLPYVLLEAMANGLPIVSTDVGGVRELVTDGLNGTIVPRRDPNALASALSRIAADCELRQSMSRQARVKVIQYSIEKMIDKTIMAYQKK